jgi:drug/metabolite transporter (DMT)-like permease
MDWFLLAFISALFSAASAVSEKKALFSIDALSFSFLVALVTLVFSFPFFLTIHYEDINSVSLIILFGKAILTAAAFLYVMLSIKNLEISEALPLLAMTPALVAIAGNFLINDKLNLLEWFGIFLMVAGTYILELKKNSKNFLEPFKSLFDCSKYSYILIALVLFTVTSLIDRMLLKDWNLPPYTFMAFQQLFFGIIFSILILFRYKDYSSPFKSLNKNMVYLILIVSVFTVIYRYTQIEATRLAPAALVVSVKRLSVLMAIIYGGKLFREDNLLRRVIAAAVILCGAAILMYE